MEMSPQLCRAARDLLGWQAVDLAKASGLGLATVKRFEAGALVRKGSVFAMQEALQGAGLEFIPAGGTSLHGGEGVRIQPTEEPEVAAAKDHAKMDLPTEQDATLDACGPATFEVRNVLRADAWPPQQARGSLA